MFVYVVIDSYMNYGRIPILPAADSDQYLLRSFLRPVVCVFVYFHNGRFFIQRYADRLARKLRFI